MPVVHLRYLVRASVQADAERLCQCPLLCLLASLIETPRSVAFFPRLRLGLVRSRSSVPHRHFTMCRALYVANRSTVNVSSLFHEPYLLPPATGTGEPATARLEL